MDEAPEVRRARVAVSAVFLVNGAALGGFASHLPGIGRHLGLDERGLGLALLGLPLGAVTTMPLAGAFVARFGSARWAVAAGIVLFGLLPFAGRPVSLLAFVATLAAVGVVNGQMDVAMNAHSMAVQDRCRRPVLSAIHGWFSVGGFLGGAGTSLATRLGLWVPGHLLAASALLGVVLLIARRSLLPSGVDQVDDGPRFVLPRGRLLGIGALVAAAFVGEGAVWDWASVYLSRSLGASDSVAALAFAAASGGLAVGRFLGDGLIHRFGAARTLTASGLLTAAGLLLGVNVPSPTLAIAAFGLAGLGLANQVPLLFRAAANVPGVPPPVGLGAATTLGYSAFLVGPPIVGLVADRTSLALALGALAGCALLVAALGRRVVRDGRPVA